MQAFKRCLPGQIDRAVDQRYEVEVADAGNVVARRQRSRHKQISDPPESRQPATELFDDRGRGRHEPESRRSSRLVPITRIDRRDLARAASVVAPGTAI